MRKRQVFAFVAATLAVGLTGAASASALTQAPARPGTTISVSHAREMTVNTHARTGGNPALPGCGFVNAVPFDRYKGLPDYTAARAARPYLAKLYTTQGLIVLKAETAAAPCTTFSFRFLAQRHFYNGTHCHRLVTQGIFVLQCGDPTGTGSGAPGYSFNDENLAGATYPAGTVAMANAGPNTNGSQFFFCTADNARLAPDYTPFATVIRGMNVLRRIAAAGDDSQNGPGDGYPHLFTAFKHIKIVFTH